MEGSALYLTYAKNITKPEPVHAYKSHAYKKNDVEKIEFFLYELYWNIFIEKYVIWCMQEFLDTIMPVYVLKLSVHFFSFYKAYYKCIPELASGYCTNVIYSVILKSAFLIYYMVLILGTLNMQNLIKSLFLPPL